VYDNKLISETKSELVAKGVQYCLATYVDVHGVPKAKTCPIASFEKMARGSELFTVGAMEGMGLVGPQEDECAAIPDLNTAVILPWDKRFVWFSSDLYYHGEPYPNCSRVLLKRVLQQHKDLTFNIGVETELYVSATPTHIMHRSSAAIIRASAQLTISIKRCNRSIFCIQW
jgi:glutamine synthetase